MSATTVRFAAKALDLLTRKGVDVQLVRRVPGDMTASGDRTEAPAPSNAKGVEFPDDGTVEIDGVRHRYARVILSAVTPSPEPDDVVQINGKKLMVLEALNWAPDGVLIFSDLKVRI